MRRAGRCCSELRSWTRTSCRPWLSQLWRPAWDCSRALSGCRCALMYSSALGLSYRTEAPAAELGLLSCDLHGYPASLGKQTCKDGMAVGLKVLQQRCQVDVSGLAEPGRSFERLAGPLQPGGCHRSHWGISLCLPPVAAVSCITLLLLLPWPLTTLVHCPLPSGQPGHRLVLGQPCTAAWLHLQRLEKCALEDTPKLSTAHTVL